jgi:hypothetical protein
VAPETWDTMFPAYVNGELNPLLTDGDYSTKDDYTWHRVNMNVGDSIVFDFGAARSVSAVKIANGNAANGGNERTKQWTIYSGTSFDGPWTSKGTVSFSAGPAAEQVRLPAVFSSRFIKMTMDSTYRPQPHQSGLLRQMGFISVVPTMMITTEAAEKAAAAE